MLQTQDVFKYLGSLQLDAGTPYLGSSFTLGNVLHMKSSGINVILNNNGLGFPMDLGERLYLDDTVKYTFSDDCVVAFSAMVEVTI